MAADRTYTEVDVQAGVLDVLNGDATLHTAAQQRGVPKTTLFRRLNGIPPKSASGVEQQHLSVAQEDSLTCWIIEQEGRGLALSREEIFAIASHILTESGKDNDIGKTWFESFKKRNPAIKRKIGRRQEANRWESFSPKAVN